MIKPLVLLVIPALFACSADPGTSVEPAEQKPIVVSTVVVEPGTLQRSFSSYGSLIPSSEFEISADVAAIVREVKFDEGQQIKAGDTLLILDDSKYQLQLRTAKARLGSAVAALEEARANHEKNASVFSRGAISELQFQQSKSRLDSAQSNVEAARAETALAQKDLAATVITSPVSGLVTERNIEPGKNITPQSSVGVISGSNLFWVETYVSQKDVNLLSVGMACDIQVSGVGEGNASLRGAVDIIASSANKNTGNYRVRVALSDPRNRLRDGMMARVTFDEIFEESVLVVPRAAVVDYHRQFAVYRYIDGIAKRVFPELSIGNANSYVVNAGVSAGDEIIVKNVNAITDGTRVVKN